MGEFGVPSAADLSMEEMKRILAVLAGIKKSESSSGRTLH